MFNRVRSTIGTRAFLARASARSSLLSRAAFSSKPEIVYTMCDEAPALATYSFLPIIQGFVGAADIDVRLSDISLSGRILANFPENLTEEQRIPDELAQLGQLCTTPDANVIKLPNISASVPQLKEAIAELQGKGYNIPNFPEAPQTPEEEAIRAKFGSVLGSVVNPVLREGNSDRRAAPAVKAFAQKYPHSMGAWSPDSKSKVVHMSGGDFFSNEVSTTMADACDVRIEFVSPSGEVKVMKPGFPLLAGEVLDSTFMSTKKLVEFFDQAIDGAKAEGVLFSLHLKATMMKVSDPIMFGHCVQVFFKELFAKHGATFEKLGVNTKNGFGDVVEKIKTLPKEQQEEIEADIQACYAARPEVAMVNSYKGITNLHVPSDVIVDASMPAMIRASGQMWDLQDKTQDCHAVIPDRSYAGIYDAIMKFHVENGAFDPTTMGTVPNVGLMAKKAEEYGSHDKTFEVPADGVMRVVNAASGEVLMSHNVETGDIWRACQTKDEPIRDWVKLAVTRARATGVPAVFWLDKNRAHDIQIIAKVDEYLKEHDTAGLELHIMAPRDAMNFSLLRCKAGKDTISVTGNVLRDYLTDLFPILELGTSAKMLSIVPLMKGGGMFETGAGGSAPKHVQQFEKEGHLRWDSLGEFLALACSLEHIGAKGHKKAQVMQSCLDKANTHFLLQNKSPSRKVNELDNRGSHFYLAVYWARELANQTEDAELAAKFAGVYKQLHESRGAIVDELSACQGKPVNVGGYYRPDDKLASEAMRPSPTFNKIVDSM